MIRRCGWLLCLLIGQMAWAAADAPLRTWPQGKTADWANVRAEVQVVNVWATWCAPCRHEMPILSRWFVEQQRRSPRGQLAVVGIAVDNDANLRRFAQQVKVAYPLWQYTGQDSTAWMRGLGNDVGALPFTLVQAPKCGFRQTILGALTAQKLNQVVAQARAQCRKTAGRSSR